MLGYAAVYIIAVLLLYYALQRRNTRNQPPGPPGLPLLGNVFQMGRDLFLTATKWKHQYGDTVLCHIGLQPAIFLHDIDTLRDVFGDEAATGRGHQFDPVSNIPRSGLVFSDGELWKERRRFAISTLRDLGIGRTWIEDTIISEVDELYRIFDSLQGRPINPSRVMLLCASNVISALVFGKRFSHDDEDFIRLVTSFADNLHIGGMDDDMLRAMPLLRYVPGNFRKRFLRLHKNRQDLMDFVQKLIDSHVKKQLSQETINDFIDAYQYEQQKAKQQQSSGGLARRSSFEDEVQMLVSVLHLFGAGTETTSTTMLYAFIYMVKYPDILKAVQHEIDTSTGPDKMVRMDHRSHLPYTEATILEVQRCASVVPLAVPHVALTDMKIDGYDVAKGTMIFANTYSIHRDPRYWNKPTTFDPSRFLDGSGKVTRPNAFVPFSVGKRVCLGENLAKSELFLFFANIMRSFTVRNAPGKTVSDAEFQSGIVTGPLPFEVVFVRR